MAGVGVESIGHSQLLVSQSATSMNSNDEKRALVREVKAQITILASLVAIAWAVEFIDIFIFGQRLNIFGIIPRNPIGLRGILFAPFLHGGLGHLIGNTIPFITLGWLIMLYDISVFVWVSIIAALVGGFGTWLFAQGGVHIGASGVIFGYLGYLLGRGYFERKPVSIAVALFVGVLYGSMLWGVLPLHPYISWEGHLFGFIGGGFAARLLNGKRSGEIG